MPTLSQIPIKRSADLSPDARRSLTEVKNAIKKGSRGKAYLNLKDKKEGTGPPLPDPDLGYEYREFDAGHAHPEDDEPRGVRRFVAELPIANKKTGSGTQVDEEVSYPKLHRIFYTDDHYTKGSFVQIRD